MSKMQDDDFPSKLDFWKRFPDSLAIEKAFELLKKYKENGDIQARDQLVLGSMRLALASCYRKFGYSSINHFLALQGQNKEDFFQQVSLWIINAIDKFDHTLENSLYVWPSYLMSFVQYDCQKYIINPFKFKKRKATVVSLEQEIWLKKRGGETVSLIKYLADDKEVPDKIISKVDIKLICDTILSLFPKRTQVIMQKYFFEEETEDEIAQEFNMSQTNVGLIIRRTCERIRYAYENGIERLKQELKKEAEIVKMVKPSSLQEKKYSVEDILAMQPSRNKGIFEAYHNGVLKKYEIAKKYNLTQAHVDQIISNIYKLCQEAGLDMADRQKEKKNELKRVTTFDEVMALQDEIERQIFDEHLQGVSRKEIGEHLNVSANKVEWTIAKIKKICERQKIPVPKKNNKDERLFANAKTLEEVLSVLSERDRKIFEYYKFLHLSKKEIEESLGLSDTTVYRVIKKVEKVCEKKGVEIEEPTSEKSEFPPPIKNLVQHTIK